MPRQRERMAGRRQAARNAKLDAPLDHRLPHTRVETVQTEDAELAEGSSLSASSAPSAFSACPSVHPPRDPPYRSSAASTTTRSVLPRPKVSGEYISSACTG